MQKKDAFAERKRAHEEEYFRRKEQELIEKMRRRAELEAERQHMAKSLGVADEEILRDLQELGYTRETVTLLHLVPLVQVAWIDGHVAHRERERILEVARLRGVQDGSPAHQQLADWLAHRPSEEFFQKTLRVIRDLLQARPPEEREASKRDLVSYCTHIAAASGGILGLGRKISEEEQTLLEQVAAELEHDHEAAAQQVVGEI
jgi:hypothetical protein